MLMKIGCHVTFGFGAVATKIRILISFTNPGLVTSRGAALSIDSSERHHLQKHSARIEYCVPAGTKNVNKHFIEERLGKDLLMERA